MSDLARDPKQIGNLIRRARKRRGLSQGALGAKAGLRQETVSLLEAGNETAKLQTKTHQRTAAGSLEQSAGRPLAEA